jgi:hypothetical protein
MKTGAQKWVTRRVKNSAGVVERHHDHDQAPQRVDGSDAARLGCRGGSARRLRGTGTGEHGQS